MLQTESASGTVPVATAPTSRRGFGAIVPYLLILSGTLRVSARLFA